MNNNEINNSSIDVPKGIFLNEKDYLNSLLSTLKELSKNYIVSMTEASNENLYERYYEAFSNISEMQREVYELMFKYGFYKLEKADNNKINNKLEILHQEYIDLDE